MTELIYWTILFSVIGILLLLWWAHVYPIMRDITREDAEELADELFRDYVERCEYRVYVTQRITITVDEPKREEVKTA